MSETIRQNEDPGGAGPPERIDLYEKWRRIYPAWVAGGFQRWRRVVLVVLLLIFYLSPWLRWNGAPGVRFDLPARQFTVFWTTFVPDEAVLLSWLLLIAALSLFTVTVALGRIFCGWACPQTMWTLVYFTIERFIEGDRTERMRRDRSPWTPDWLSKKALKFTAWTLVALSISITFVGYFTEIRELLPRIATLDLSRWERVFLVLPAAGSFFFSAVLREQVCFHMCPYARFQSVMLDRDSMIISYDEPRGEPRGHRSRKADPEQAGLGSCVDCNRCVVVCPTGIDIRDGLQYQCIGCAACIDACTDIMDQMGYGESLVRYSSENRDQGVESRRVRPRLIGYASLIVVLLALVSTTIAGRVPLDLDIMRDRNRLYRQSWDGSVENVYSLRITNRGQETRRFEIRVEGDLPVDFLGESVVSVEGGAMRAVPVSLVADSEAAQEAARSPVVFSVRALNEPDIVVSAESRFHRPIEEVGG